MGINYNNQPIVTDSLVLYYDAENLNSYRGTGNVWNDLSGNVNSATLSNTIFTLEQPKSFTCRLRADYNVSWSQYSCMGGSDRNGTLSGGDPTINLYVGDTITFDMDTDYSLNNAAGDLWISTTRPNIIGVTNPYATNNGTAGQDITWTPTTAGTYYYQSEDHTNMWGYIYVTAIGDLSDTVRAIVFNGTNARGTFDAGSVFGFGTGQFTFEMWVNTYHDGAWGWYFTNKTSAGGTTRIQIGVSGSTEKFGFGFSSLADNPTFPINSWSGWKHIVTSREGTGANQYKLYINGELIGSVTNDTDYASDGIAGYLGAWEDTEYIKAKLSCFKVYKGKGLTAAEVLQNYNATKGRFGL